MSSEIADLYVTLRGNSKQLVTSLQEAQAESGKTDSAFSRLRGSLAKIGIAEVTVAAAIATVSVKLASNFDAAMERVHTQAGATQSEVDGMKASVLSLAGATAQAPIDLANGLYHIESAGFRGVTAMNILKQSAKLATIGQADLETVTGGMVAMLASGIGGIKNYTDAAALMNQTVGIGDMRMQDFASALSTGILPAGRNVGLMYKDVAASLATLTDNHVSAEEAATRLRMTFSMMSAPTHAATKALSGIGMTSDELGNLMRKPDGLLRAVLDLKQHLESTFPTSAHFVMSQAQMVNAAQQYRDALIAQGQGAKEADANVKTYMANLTAGGKRAHDANATAQNAVLSRAFGGGRSSSAIETLLNETGRLKSKYDELGSASSRAKTFQDAWQSTLKQFHTQIGQIKAAAESWLIQLGNRLIPVIEKVIGWVMEGAKWLSKHRQVAQDLAITIGALLVPGLISLGVAIVSATWPVLAIGAAIFGLVYGLRYAWNHFKIFRDVVRDVVGAVKGWITGLVDWWNSRFGEIEVIGRAFEHFLAGLWHGIEIVALAVWHDILRVIKFVWDAIRLAVKFGVDLVRNVINVFLDVLSGHWGKVWGDLKKLVVDLFKDAGKWLWHVGQDLIRGLIDGITSAVGGIGRAIGQVAGGVVGTFKHLFGIHSPSKVFAEMGGHLMSGLALGIQNGAGMATSALAGVGANLSLSGVGGYGSVAAPIYVTLNPTFLVDGREVAVAVQPGMIRTGQRYKFRNGVSGMS